MIDTAIRVPAAEPEIPAALNGVPASEVRTELDRILRSHVFVHSYRIRRFLQFVVEECLLGQHHRLKEYLIGLEVFNRSDNFDPRVDSIVRVEARRLRAKLDEYYLTEGRGSEIRIRLRKGSYVPVFEYRSSEAEVSLPGRHWRRSIAITPFTSGHAGMAGSPLAEELKRRVIHVLVNHGHFDVLTWSSSEPTAEDGAASSQKADYVLTASMEPREDRIALLFQLHSSGSQGCVWSSSVEFRPGETADLQAAVREMHRALLLARSNVSAFPRRSSDKPGASLAYARALSAMRRGSPECLTSGLRELESATTQDPDFSAAWAALSIGSSLGAMLGLYGPEAGTRAREAAQRATALNANLPEAQAACGAALSVFDWNWAEGEEKLQKARQMDVNGPLEHVIYGAQLAGRGMLEAAATEISRAMDIDPASMMTNLAGGWIQTVCGNYDQAMALFGFAREMEPNSPFAHIGLGRAQAGQGKFQEALESFSEAHRLQPDNPLTLAYMGFCHGALGAGDQARSILSKLEVTGESRYVPRSARALVYAGLRDMEQAVEYLTEAIDRREPVVPFLALGCEFSFLAGDPRWAELLGKVGISQTAAAAAG